MFRFIWTFRVLRSRVTLARARQHLRNPYMFYLAILCKLGGFSRAPIRLRLRDGGVIRVRDFMTLYIFKEIFFDSVYAVESGGIDVKTIIDVGANTGVFLLWARRRWPLANIHSFEPESWNFAELRKTVEENGLTGVSLYNQALSSACGDAQLFIDYKNVGGHSMYHQRSAKAVRVRTLTIDEALTKLGSDLPCDLLKIDCEGCEKEIFEGLSPELAGRINAIVFETEESLYDIAAVKRLLESLDFDVKRLGDRTMYALRLVESSHPGTTQ